MTVANTGITTNTQNTPNKPSAHFFHQTAGMRHAERSKICSKCNEIRPITSFNKSAKKADGLHTQCRACRSTYQNGRLHAMDAHTDMTSWKSEQALRRSSGTLTKAADDNRKTTAKAAKKAKREALVAAPEWKATKKGLDRAIQRTPEGGDVLPEGRGYMRTLKDTFDIYSRRVALNNAENLGPNDPEAWEVDHKIAIVDGGMHEPSNLQLLRRSENMAKEKMDAARNGRNQRASDDD